MKLKLVMSGILGLALSAPAFADPGEDFPTGPKPETGEVLPGGDEKEMEEEQIDVVGILEGIVGKMKDAEQSLAITDIEGAAEAAGKAAEKMSKVFEGSNKNQTAAIQDLEKLIKAAKEGD